MEGKGWEPGDTEEGGRARHPGLYWSSEESVYPKSIGKP